MAVGGVGDDGWRWVAVGVPAPRRQVADRDLCVVAARDGGVVHLEQQATSSGGQRADGVELLVVQDVALLHARPRPVSEQAALALIEDDLGSPAVGELEVEGCTGLVV